jgi:type II secretory ATPase GspE/PulE/Tfp pilus assembly ATPase PilB-like protein
VLALRKTDVPNLDPAIPMPLSEIEEALDNLLGLGETGAVRAIDMIICQAIHHRASDLHLEPWHDALSLRFRLDGVLHEVAMLPRKHHDKVVARAKVLANMIIYQKELPQDGRIEAHEARMNRALRASTFPTIHGEKLVVRIIDAQQDLLRTDALGFRKDVVDGLRNVVFKPQGTMLLTGPSSSGKTTTIYSLLRELMAQHASTRHIVTIEDPVESQLGRISQTQISPNLGFTFQTAFRSLLRQDPDVIMVGEIRDPDTANIAVQAGLTGHLVISTIHSGTAAGVFTRLLDMGVQPYLAASSVNGVLAQRLLRINCKHCAKPYKPEPALMKQYGIDGKNAKFRRGTGCAQCRGIGFRGRTAIGELLTVNDEFAELVLTRARSRVLHETALATGMIPLLQDALQRALEGQTTLEELRFVIPPPEEHERSTNGTRTAKKRPIRLSHHKKPKIIT